MARSVQEIRDLREYLVTDYHGGRIIQQAIGENYYTDNFRPALLKPPTLDHPTGEAARQIDLPAEHLSTGNPQAFRMARTKAEIDGAARVAQLFNHWLKRIKRQSPDPLHLSLKTNLKRGQVWIQLILNEDWTSKEQEGLPVWFHIPDPMIVFASPKSTDCVPEEVIVSCERNLADIERVWPKWKDKNLDKRVKFLAYYGKKQRYFEAGNDTIFEDDNIMKVVPFIGVYTGYGSDSLDAKPEDMAVGRLRHMRSLLDAERVLFSDMLSLVHRFAYPHLDFLRKDENVPDDAVDGYSAKPFNKNI